MFSHFLSLINSVMSSQDREDVEKDVEKDVEGDVDADVEGEVEVDNDEVAEGNDEENVEEDAEADHEENTEDGEEDDEQDAEGDEEENVENDSEENLEEDGENDAEGDGEENAEEDDKEGMDYAGEIYEVITKYVENPLELSTYATGGELGKVPAVRVEGIGRIGYPLSIQQSAALLAISTQAPFGKGTNTVVDMSVRRAWQISSDLVKIDPAWLNTSLPKLVADCCAKLGMDAVRSNVQAHLYKMLLYEEGGHFKKHRDTEKEPGMFGSLLVQLPAEHEGGCLVVEHAGQSKRFQFDKESGDKAYYASFYADCEHTLEPVTSGLRLVLAFNLVRGVETASASSAAASATHRKGFEEALVNAAKAWCADEDAVEKLAFPLAHEYTRTNVSFAGLKGDDLKTLNLLKNATNSETGEKLFSVYLALVDKHVTGVSEDDGDYYGRYGGGGGGGMGEIIETDYETANWVGPHGAVDLGALSIDFESELLTAPGDDVEEARDALFGEDPAREEDEGYCGNYAGSLEYWYEAAVLVFWPAQRDFDIKLTASPQQAIAVLDRMDRASADYQEKLSRLLVFLSKGGVTWTVSSVLPLVLDLPQARKVLSLGAGKVVSEGDMQAVAAAVGKYGLAALRDEVTEVLTAQTLSAALDLLGMLQPHCATQEQATAESTATTSTSSDAVPVVFWGDLVQVLVTKVLKSDLTDADAVLLRVCMFIAAYCDDETHVTVSQHLGVKAKLKSLNHVITELTAGEHPVRAPHLRGLLQQSAVALCTRHQQQPPADVVALVEWVVRGEHAELLQRLQPRLLSLCASPELFRALFALPCVLAELKRDSAVSALLESLVQARINAVAAHAAPPAFTWSMPGLQNTSSDPRLGEFLRSAQQTVALGGYNGIGHARNWASKYIDRTDLRRSVSAIPSGTGPRAMVTLTKNRSHHDSVVKACAANAEELQKLRRLLRVRDRDAAGASTAAAASSAPSVDASASASGATGASAHPAGQPAAKKARVEGANAQDAIELD